MVNRHELRPCPFCSSTDLKLYTTECGNWNSFRRGIVRCQKCGAEVRALGGGTYDFPEECTVEEKRMLSNERAYRRAAALWNGEPDELA